MSAKFDMVHDYMDTYWGMTLERGGKWKTGYSMTGDFQGGLVESRHYGSLDQIIKLFMQHCSVDNLSHQYYKKNYEAFIKRTIDIDMSNLHLPFISGIPTGGRILDAGCGSGRDSVVFVNMGYKVVAIDICWMLQKEIAKRGDVEVHTMAFEEVEWDCRFDGVWASNSLLHVPPESFDDSINRLYKSIKPGGVMYMSFYHGEHARQRRCTKGRLFTDQNEFNLRAIAGRLGAEVLSIRLMHVQSTNRLAIYSIMKKPQKS